MEHKLHAATGKNGTTVGCAKTGFEQTVQDGGFQMLAEVISQTEEPARDTSAAVAKQFWHDIISSDKKLYSWIGFDRKSFSKLLEYFVKKWEVMERGEMERRREYAEGRSGKRGPRPKADVIADRQNNIPLIHDDPIRSRLPGNRCTLDPLHILLMALVRKYCNLKEVALGTLFGVDQSTVSRYLVPADLILEEILPTPNKILERIKSIVSPEEFVKLFPKGKGDTIMILDGTVVRVFKPIKSTDRDSLMSDRKKYACVNTLVMTSSGGLILGISSTYKGSMHDMAVTREFLKGLGPFGEMLKRQDDSNTPDADGVVALPATPAGEPAEDAWRAGQEITPDADVAPTGIQTKTAKTLTEQEKTIQEKTIQEKTIQEKTDHQTNRHIPNAVTKAMDMLFNHTPDIPNAIATAMHMLFNSTPVQIDAIDAMVRLQSPPRDKIQCMADSGFQGLKKAMLGADVHHPYRKPPKKELTREQKKYNQALSKQRIKIEHAIGWTKHFERVSDTYNGSLDNFNREFNIAAGLANFRHMMRNDTFEHWAQELGLGPPDAGR